MKWCQLELFITVCVYLLSHALFLHVIISVFFARYYKLPKKLSWTVIRFQRKLWSGGSIDEHSLKSVSKHGVGHSLFADKLWKTLTTIDFSNRHFEEVWREFPPRMNKRSDFTWESIQSQQQRPVIYSGWDRSIDCNKFLL